MKVVIYICTFWCIIGLISPLSLKNKSQTDAKTNLKSGLKTTSELTFSAANSENNPESTKMMENVFSARPVHVEAKFSVIGEPDPTLEDKLTFGDRPEKSSLRFKQNAQADFGLKNLEIPEIRRTNRERLPEPQHVDPAYYNLDYTKKVYNYNNIQSIEANLLNSFQDSLRRNILRDYPNIENISVTQVQVMKQNSQ